MVRARLWYGPAGHELGLDRFARYLRGPLGCALTADPRGRTNAPLLLRDPLPATVELNRRPEVSTEVGALIARLPADAPAALAERLAACTARLEFSDIPTQTAFTPGSTLARSVLLPLAIAVDGVVEEVETGRLHFRAPPPPQGAGSAFMRALSRILGALRRR
ncbi:MAG: hypothetical protein JXJ18_07275 [Rhodobacteraceae bacterium]|nr:hypothetical protein [Paracoccaceae bacterium]